MSWLNEGKLCKPACKKCLQFDKATEGKLNEEIDAHIKFLKSPLEGIDDPKLQNILRLIADYKREKYQKESEELWKTLNTK